MFGKNPNFRTKLQVAVKVRIGDAEPIVGFVFLRPDERLIDLLNDDRSFIPIKYANGETDIISKTCISNMMECIPEEDEEYNEEEHETGVVDLGDEDAYEDDEEGVEEDLLRAAAAAEAKKKENADADDKTAKDADRREQKPKDDDTADSSTSSSSSSHEGPKRPKRRRGRVDPYKILRVSSEASLDEIRSAYKERIKAVHPDRLGGLELDDEFGKAALVASQRVNRAYQAILKERERAQSEAKDEDEAEDGQTTKEAS